MDDLQYLLLLAVIITVQLEVILGKGIWSNPDVFGQRDI